MNNILVYQRANERALPEPGTLPIADFTPHLPTQQSTAHQHYEGGHVDFVSHLVIADSRIMCDNDPSAGSPTETLLRLHLPLNDKVQTSSHN